MENYKFRKAVLTEVNYIWPIFQAAINRRKADGSDQWQDGYPNPEVIKSDIINGYAYVLTLNSEFIGYLALIYNDEPAYESIDGSWLSHGDFAVLHRIVVSEAYIGRGLAKILLQLAEMVVRNEGIQSIKVDTNFDNPAMIKSFERLDFQYCGEVDMRGAKRKAFEKILN